MKTLGPENLAQRTIEPFVPFRAAKPKPAIDDAHVDIGHFPKWRGSDRAFERHRYGPARAHPFAPTLFHSYLVSFSKWFRCCAFVTHWLRAANSTKLSFKTLNSGDALSTWRISPAICCKSAAIRSGSGASPTCDLG